MSISSKRAILWSGIGFPRDESLIVNEYEENTIIEESHPYVVGLRQDISDILAKPAKEVADEGEVKQVRDFERLVEIFKVHGRPVIKVTIEGCDVREPSYATLKISKDFESRITSEIGEKPDLQIVQWVATHILLRRAGQIGGRTTDYWKRLTDLARQQLHVNTQLETEVRQQMKSSEYEKDQIFHTVLGIVKKCILRSTPDPYYQSRRDQHALDRGFFYETGDAEIVLVLDGFGKIIAFQCADAFRKLLTKGVERDVSTDFETFTTCQPVPLPDMTRHGLHYVDWLAERPELDFRDPRSDPRTAKSGVYHFGAHCQVGDPHGRRGVHETLDSGERLHWRYSGHARRQQKKLMYSALGACTSLVRFFFALFEPALLASYQRVAGEVEKLDDIPFLTRRTGEPFAIKALLVNVMTNEHTDDGDWRRGLAGLVSVGDFEGGDLLLRQLGLRIKAAPGSVQLIRGRELRHSISRWTGRRFVAVLATHEAVRRWALRQTGGGGEEDAMTTTESSSSSSTTSNNHSCLDANLEDVMPEQLRVLTEEEWIPERHTRAGRRSGSDLASDEQDETDKASSSEASMEAAPTRRNLGQQGGRRETSLSDPTLAKEA
ncbi:hypothetical protein GGR56DRAFT_671825 [Xylariaceae sp. FL0804]|nr:hypothetical protein GGR56DRAFT_671825 [Xylariaceae sp. FL0804]